MRYQDKAYLAHHGILGQKWGVRRFQNKDGSYTNAGKKRKNLDKSKKENDTEDKKKGLSRNQKIAIAATGAALAAVGGYYLYKTGKLDGLINIGKKSVNASTNLAGNADDIFNDRFAGKLTKLKTKETFSETLSRVNPLKGSEVGKNNCVPCAIAGYFRKLGYDVTAKDTSGKMQNTAGVVEEVFKGAKILEGSAVKFGRSSQDASEMLLKRYGENASGLCTIDWKKGGGHCFSWEIKDSVVKFFDFQQGRDDSIVRKYFDMGFIDPNGQLVLARLDQADIDVDALKKYVNVR